MKLSILSSLFIILLCVFLQIERTYFLEKDAENPPKTSIKNPDINYKDRSIIPIIEADFQERLEAKKKQIIKHNEAIRKLDAILQTSEDASARIFAISQLEKIGGNDAVNSISRGLSDNDINVRSHVIKTLSGMNNENTVHLLGQVLFSKEDQELKLQAIDAISANINSAGLYLLEFSSKHETDETIKHKIDDILAFHENKSKYFPEEVTEDYYDVMQNAKYLPPEKSVKSLQYILKKSIDSDLREEAIVELANNPEKDAVSIIKETLLSDKSNNVRFQAIKILANTDVEMLPALGQVLFTDPDPDLRIEAIELIALEKSPANLVFLRQALNDPVERVRNAAAHFLP